MSQIFYIQGTSEHIWVISAFTWSYSIDFGLSYSLHLILHLYTHLSFTNITKVKFIRLFFKFVMQKNLEVISD